MLQHRPGSATFVKVLPRRIVRYRELRGVTQAALAKAAQVSRSTLNSIESGQALDLRVSTLERLCHALGVSTDALLGFDMGALVRNPLLRGCQPHPGTIAPLECPVCGALVPGRALHLPGECMLTLSDGGATFARIGAAFGLSDGTVEFALREEHEARRHRVF